MQNLWFVCTRTSSALVLATTPRAWFFCYVVLIVTTCSATCLHRSLLLPAFRCVYHSRFVTLQYKTALPSRSTRSTQNRSSMQTVVQQIEQMYPQVVRSVPQNSVQNTLQDILVHADLIESFMQELGANNLAKKYLLGMIQAKSIPVYLDSLLRTKSRARARKLWRTTIDYSKQPRARFVRGGLPS